MAEISNYPLYLKLLREIENDDFSGYAKLIPILQNSQNRVNRLWRLVESMANKPNDYLSYTVSDNVVLNNKLPSYIDDYTETEARNYLRAICSKTKEGEYFTVNFRGGLISTITCFGHRFKKQLHKLFRYHPITFVSFVDMPTPDCGVYIRTRWTADNINVGTSDYHEYEIKYKKYFKSANEIEFDMMLSDVAINKYRKNVRGEYV